MSVLGDIAWHNFESVNLRVRKKHFSNFSTIFDPRLNKEEKGKVDTWLFIQKHGSSVSNDP